MKVKHLTHLLVLIMALVIVFASCDADDGGYTQNVEGHWVYSGTKVDVYVTDTTIKKVVEEYMLNRNKKNKVSYEFKNDRTYYYYQNFEDPLKGIFKSIDKDYFVLDDTHGMKTVVREDTIIYVVSDLREEIAKELQIDKQKIVKALATDSFRRGLFVD